MDEKSFYDIEGVGNMVPDSAAENINGENTHDHAVSDATSVPDAPRLIIQGEIKMADVDTNMLASQHSDIRREAAEHKNEIVREGLKESFNIRGDVKDSRYEVDTRIGEAKSDLTRQIDAIDDTFTKQASDYFIANQQYAFNAARDLSALKAQQDMAFMKLGQDIQTQGALGQAAAALQAEKIATAVALGQSTLSKEIFADGQKTRDLINDLKYHDLNRTLIERNTELVEEREGRRYWRHHADQNQFQGQWAALQSQIQAFASQLQETRQGMVNFGTMAGVGQSSTSNNVR